MCMQTTYAEQQKASPDKLVTPFDWSRAFITNRNARKLEEAIYGSDRRADVLGLMIFLVAFVGVVPYLLLQSRRYLVATAYLCNIDLVATVLAFSGGPFDMWRFLYNPNVHTLFGFISATLINYIAVCGVAFIAVRYALKENDEHYGLAKLLVAIPITYLIPGHFIVYLMNSIAAYLWRRGLGYYLRWALTLGAGAAAATAIIFAEVGLTVRLTPTLMRLTRAVFSGYGARW